MKRNVVGILALLMLTFTQCKKDDNSGNNTAASSYLVVTEGSKFTYHYTENNQFDTTYKLTVTNRDTTALGKTFRVYNSTFDVNRYFGKNGDDYLQLSSLPTVGVDAFLETYLKDNITTNSTWSSQTPFSYPNVGDFIAKLTYTVKETGITHTVGSLTFNNVIRVRTDITVSPFIGNVGYIERYFAKGIGLISETSNINVALTSQTFTSTQVLTAYEIK